MVQPHDDDGGDGREEGPRVACETGPRKKARKRKRKRRSAKAPSPPPPPPPAPSQEHRVASGDDDRSAQIKAAMLEQVRHMLHVEATTKKETAELINRLNGEESDFSVEDTFGDCDDGSLESFQARKVALLVSKSIVSLSSFAGGKRIRVCSGFVTDCTGATMILTSATLVRSLNGDNNVISDVTVKVLLPDGRITMAISFLWIFTIM